MRRRWFVMAAAALALLVGQLAACSPGAGTGTSHTSGAGGAQGFTLLTPQQLHRMMAERDVYLVNVHVPYEGEIPGTDAFIPYTEIASRLGELPFGAEPVVIYCRSGVTSEQAAEAMVAAGAPAFYELQGGYTAWQAVGYPFRVK
jgi:phage shock protein E